ncbi:DNA-binding transcriptional regulator, GntR family [Devosia crocina]|uniref:DNA-binding transcriptional regulator, GntR family n=1 Tax=Devosia crocina TaxID=429728 RepID=A0A1I7MXS6_9HYPH|nr:GntR family transcriptional regulator [Devosia crocina]SFV27184.1 DNA-binding transcriptional regulator, GntR family [Devosia crocina]
MDLSTKTKISLTDRAYQQLRQRIITGQLPPGSEMSELELADDLAMSKTPVREALGRLGVEGLVEAFPRRGYRVTSVTVKDMNDLFAVRAMLEGTAGALAAVNLTESELAQLDALADASYVRGENVSTQSFVRANEDFHTAIARASRNPRLLSLVVSHLEECGRFFYMGAQVRDVNPETSNDHHKIVAVLRQRDPEAARAAMVEHNENTRQGLIHALLDRPHSGISF